MLEEITLYQTPQQEQVLILKINGLDYYRIGDRISRLEQKLEQLKTYALSTTKMEGV